MPTKSDELKPCPFCGGKAELLMGPRGIARVKCSICHCQTKDIEPDMIYGIPISRHMNAIMAWNRRAIQPMPQSVIDALEKISEGFAGTIYCCNDCPLYPCGVDDPSNKALCKNAMAKAMARAAGWSV